MLGVRDPAHVRAGVQMHWGVKVPLRDGIQLNGTVYLPEAHTGRSPAVLTMTPYLSQMWHEFDLYFAAHGYPFVMVDARGRGNSGGVFKPLINEAQDGYDVVEWLAKEPYCNGQVSMWGGSYAGYAQWATAKEFPPHLVTIVPVAAACAGVDFPMACNIARPYLMQWLTLVYGRTVQDRLFFNSELFWGNQFRRWLEAGVAFRDLDTFLGNPSAHFQEWLAHPEPDAHWDRFNPTPEQYAQLCIPILTI